LAPADPAAHAAIVCPQLGAHASSDQAEPYRHNPREPIRTPRQQQRQSRAAMSARQTKQDSYRNAQNNPRYKQHFCGSFSWPVISSRMLTRPVGRPPKQPIVSYASFRYQAAGWTRARRVVAKVEWHQGELYLLPRP